MFEILDRLCKKCWYSCLDVKSGYHQILRREEDRCKTAFFLGNNHFKFFLRMPYRQHQVYIYRMINISVEGLENELVYLDNLMFLQEQKYIIINN